MHKKFCLDGHPVASIVDCRQHLTKLTTWPPRRLETATTEMTTTQDSDNFCIRSNELSDFKKVAQFVHVIRAGAPT